jgi:hypothetical protein
MVYVIGPRDKKIVKALKENNVPTINTTSLAKGEWSVGLSPFYLGPIFLYGSYKAIRMENAWQFTKAYAQHIDTEGNPSPAYFEWAKEGWDNQRAIRYPMGKGAKPEYSWWDGKKYDYVSARKKIYAPLYIKCVVPTEAFKKLKEVRDEYTDIALWDFDGYDYVSLNKTLREVINDPNKKMGHAFVLAMLLTLKREEILDIINS